MLTNVQRIRLYEVILVAVVILVGFLFNLDASRKLSDIRLINDVRGFGSAMELFKRDQWRYPQGASIDLRHDTVLSDNGLAPGNKVYYRGRMGSGRPILLQTTEEGYQVRFSLNAPWLSVGLDSRGCTLNTGAVLSCNK